MTSVSEYANMLIAAGVTMKMLDEELVKAALGRSNGRITAAAKLLGITRDQVRYRIKRYKLDEYVHRPEKPKSPFAPIAGVQ